MKDNWQTKKLSEICDKASSNISQNQLTKEEGIYPIFGAGGFIKNISFFQRDKDYISIIKDGAGIGRVSLLPSESSVIGTLQYIIPKDNIDLKFLYYIMNSFDFSKYKNGATIPHIYFREYAEEQFVIPPLSEQKRIVKVLDEVFNKVEKTKKNAEKNLQNAKELFESYLQSVFANPGKDWEEKKIKEIGKTQTGLTPKTANKKYYGNFVPFITPADVDILGDGSIRYNSKGLSEEGLEVGRKIEKNSVLMVCIGATIGKVGFATEIVSCNQQINTLTPEIKYDAKLFYYILSTKSFFNKVIEGSSQATLPIINKGKWENLIVTFPKSLIEQKSIVAKLDALLVETKKLETIYKQKMADLEELKKSVLKRAFNGDL